MPKEFLYYLTEQDGRSLYVQNDVVSSTGIHRPLPNTPDGWSELSVAWERNMSKYYGLTRNFSIPLSFYFDAAFILRDAAYRTNIERKIFLLIQQYGLEYTDDYYKHIYQYLYKGELDFSTFKSDQDRVTINIMEGGLSKQLKANENTVYEIPFDEDLIDVILDGIELEINARFLINNGMNQTDVDFEFRNHFIDLYDVTAETSSKLSTKPITRTVFTGTNTDLPGNENWFFAPTVDCTLDLTWNFKVGATVAEGGVLDPSGRTSIMFQVVTTNGTVDDARSVNVFFGLLSGTGNVLTGSASIDVVKGEHVYFRTFFTVIGSTGDAVIKYNYYDIEDSFLDVRAFFVYPPSSVKCYKPIDVFKKLCIKIFGSDSYAASELLELNSNLALTCGDAIRGLSGATIKTSFSDFFEDYNVTCFAGLSIENGLIKIEDRATFFDTSDPIDLGNIKNHEISYASDLVGNVIKVGHTKPDIEDINGKFDPNGSSVFTTPITRVAKEINIVGPYKKGPYEIEITRINLDGKTTTDNNNDNDCFVLDVKPVVETYDAVAGTFDSVDTIVLTGLASALSVFNGVKGFYLNDGTTQYLFLFELAIVSGSDLEITVNNPDLALPVTFSNYSISFPYILDRTAVVDSAAEVCPSPETIFNVRLTPKNILLKHGRWIRSLMWGFDSGKIKFQSGDKNTKFKAVVNGVTIDEDTDVNINSLGDRLFIPYYHDFETLVPTNLVDLMETNPNRCFQFTDSATGRVLTGFNIKSALAPNTEQAQRFKLLSSPLNDLLTLIY